MLKKIILFTLFFVAACIHSPLLRAQEELAPCASQTAEIARHKKAYAVCALASFSGAVSCSLVSLISYLTAPHAPKPSEDSYPYQKMMEGRQEKVLFINDCIVSACAAVIAAESLYHLNLHLKNDKENKKDPFIAMGLALSAVLSLYALYSHGLDAGQYAADACRFYYNDWRKG